MTVKEAEDYVYESYLRGESRRDYNAPDSQKRDPSLTAEIIKRRRSPRAIVVTGSKGKGSVAAMMASVLSTRNRTGLMTSPHIACFRERFTIDGVMISEDEFVEHILAVKPEIDAVTSRLADGSFVSPMGVQAALALDWFRSESTDIDILECGKGAQFDDVNNAVHQSAVINTIFMEHTRELGATVAEIAADKAHVITYDTQTVYVAPQQSEAMAAIEDRAALTDTAVKVYGRDFRAENVRYTRSGMSLDVVVGDRCIVDVTVPLLGLHQARNCALAVAAALDADPQIEDDFIRRAIDSIKWPGRQQVVRSKPFVMVDACINRRSCAAVIETLGFLGVTDFTAIVGIPDDKDFAGVVAEIRRVASKVILTKSSNPHYRFSSSQVEVVGSHGVEATWSDSLEEAVSKAINDGCGQLVILGTTSIVSDAGQIDFSGL